MSMSVLTFGKLDPHSKVDLEIYFLDPIRCRRRNSDVLARTALSYQTKLKGLMPTKLPTAFRLDGRTVDSVRSEHQRCQAAEPAFSNGESCFGQAMLARHAFASGFIHKTVLSMSTEVEAHNTRHRPGAIPRIHGSISL